MEREEKDCKLFTQGKDEEIMERKITQEELGKIFFNEGNRKWDNVHLVLPESKWEKIYKDGCLLYEGYTLDHKAFGAGKCFYTDGTPWMEGIFGLKGLLCGKVYYSNGVIRYEGMFRLNQAYGPNYPEYGAWYDQNGRMLYRGEFKVFRSSQGWPKVYKPEKFGAIPNVPLGTEHLFMWEDVKRLKL